MLIKLEPEDFVVKELARWEKVERGPAAVYSLRKKKLDTFEALRMVAAHAEIPLSDIHYVGLKDRQAVTTQHISIPAGKRIEGRIPGITTRYLGRAPAQLSAENLLGNAFELVVRDLTPAQLEPLEKRLAMVQAHGIVNYFDDQRFGTLTAGQGLPGRELVKGEYEQAVKLLLATPGKRDPYPEKRFKHLVQKSWGDWETVARKWGNRKGKAIVRQLKKDPQDFAGALVRMPARERAIHVFAYQSLIWNEAVGRYLSAKVGGRRLRRTKYSGGHHVWLNVPAEQELPELVESFPLLDHEHEVEDPEVKAACDAALAAEGLTQAEFRIDGIKGCFFKHHERPLLVRPRQLKIVKQPGEDDRRPGRLKVGLHLELPPGAYATLVLRQLFGAAPQRGDVAHKQRDIRQKKKARRKKRSEQARTGVSKPPQAKQKRRRRRGNKRDPKP